MLFQLHYRFSLSGTLTRVFARGRIYVSWAVGRNLRLIQTLYIPDLNEFVHLNKLFRSENKNQIVFEGGVF